MNGFYAPFYKIVTTFQIDILKEVERGGGVKEQIERLTKFLS